MQAMLKARSPTIVLYFLHSLVSHADTKHALNQDEPRMIVGGREAQFYLHYGQQSDLDITAEIVEIPNFFPEEFLEKAHADLTRFTRGANQAPDPDHGLFTTSAADKKLRSNQNIEERFSEVHRAMRNASQEQYRPRVLYTKWELSKSEEAQALHKRFWNEMESVHIMDKLAATLGTKMGRVSHSFISMFHKGDFLSTHAASRWEGRGEWAYTLYLSKDWKPEYGGNLYLLDSRKGHEDSVAHVCVPEYSKMVLFRLKPNCPLHFVSQVRADKPRMALTGWYTTEQQQRLLRKKGVASSTPPFLIPLNETQSGTHRLRSW